MILDVVNAEYLEDFKIHLFFSNNDEFQVDLKSTIYSDHRKIFEPLRSVNYFKSFKIRLNTITWDNEADFAPEFLLALGKSQLTETLSFH